MPEMIIDQKTRQATNGEPITLSFGSVELRAERDPDVFAANVRASQEALRRAQGVFVRSGVELDFPASVPKFFIDERKPAVLIRELDGKREEGHLVDGQFVAA